MFTKKHITALALAIVAAVLLAAASLAASVGDHPAGPSAGRSDLSVRARINARLLALKSWALPPQRIVQAPASRPGSDPAGTPLTAAKGEAETTVVPAASVGSGERMSDALIEARIKNELYAKTGKSSFAIDVASTAGVVSLSGQMPDRAHRDEALRIARHSPGVREVLDQMKFKASEN